MDSGNPAGVVIDEMGGLLKSPWIWLLYFFFKEKFICIGFYQHETHFSSHYFEENLLSFVTAQV